MSDEPAPPVPVPAGGYVQRNREHRRRCKFRLQGVGKIAARGGGQPRGFTPPSFSPRSAPSSRAKSSSSALRSSSCLCSALGARLLPWVVQPLLRVRRFVIAVKRSLCRSIAREGPPFPVQCCVVRFPIQARRARSFVVVMLPYPMLPSLLIESRSAVAHENSVGHH